MYWIHFWLFAGKSFHSSDPSRFFFLIAFQFQFLHLYICLLFWDLFVFVNNCAFAQRFASLCMIKRRFITSWNNKCVTLGIPTFQNQYHIKHVAAMVRAGQSATAPWHRSTTKLSTCFWPQQISLWQMHPMQTVWIYTLLTSLDHCKDHDFEKHLSRHDFLTRDQE